MQVLLITDIFWPLEYRAMLKSGYVTMHRWKGETPSGVLRLEVTLFSGFQLLSVSPVVIDNSGNLADIHHGSRADKIWFVLTNVSIPQLSSVFIVILYLMKIVTLHNNQDPSVTAIQQVSAPN